MVDRIRVLASVPVHPKVRACAEIDPVIFVSLTTDSTTLEFNRPAANVPVQPRVSVAFSRDSVPVTLVSLIIVDSRLIVLPFDPHTGR